MTERLAAVPPMGWNSWNTLYDDYNEETVKQMADVMADEGYLDCGYRYLILDDCWAERERDENGRLVPSHEKFPDGLEPVIDYVHKKGLKFGIYACCGVKTCAGYPGSFEHEKQDAETFAEWGVDYLKYDNCYRPTAQKADMLYRRMSYALRNSGRDIVLAACQWGREEVEHWIRSTGAQTYRSTIDIRDNWESVKSIADKRLLHLEEGGPCCHNDMDMLVVGMNGGGSNPETTAEGCSLAEYQTHFALWAMLNSPLIIGCDIRKTDGDSKKILQNRDLIAINQDPEVRTCYMLSCECSPGTFALVRPLSDGSYAAGVFNFSEENMKAGFTFWDLGISAAVGQKLFFHDCLTHEDMGVLTESCCIRLDPHECKVFRMKSVD